MKKIFKLWFLPSIFSLGLFLVGRPILAQQMEEQTNLRDYLNTRLVPIGSEVVDGYSQIYYEYENNKVFITAGSINHRLPSMKGEYVAYVGDINEIGQIFLHHVSTGNVIQLTSTGTNSKPVVSKEGKVVWEGWVDDRWQVFLFDGTRVAQLTTGDLATNPDIEGDFVSLARRDITDTWRAEVYSMSRKKSVDVTTGIGTKRPKLTGSKIILLNEKGRADEFDLTVEDLFTLDLEPLTGVSNDIPQSITIEEVLKELEATSAADLVEPTEEDLNNVTLTSSPSITVTGQEVRP